MPTYDQINALYQRYLGRPASQDEANNWISGVYGATDLGGIEQQIASSGEAQNYRQAQIAPGPFQMPPQVIATAAAPTPSTPAPGTTATGSGAAPKGTTLPNWITNPPTQGNLGRVTTSEQAFASSQINPNNIILAYRTYLGRDPSSTEIQNWQNGTYGAATDMAGVTQQIASSGEAQAYAKAHGGSGTSSTTGGDLNSPDLMTRIKAALAAVNSTDDPNYWFGVMSKDPNALGSAWAYWQDRINRGDGSSLVKNGTLQRFQDSSGGSGGGQTGAGNSYYGLAGNTGGAPFGTLQAYGVPTIPYQSQPYTGGPYTPPALPDTLQTPYQAPTWQGGAFTATPYAQRFTAPTPGDALRTGNTYDPNATANLPHFASGGTDLTGGAAVVGEQGPEVVNLPPGSSVTPTVGQSVDPSAPWASFYAPSSINEQNDPGYQARLDLDQQARQRSAAAQGSVLSGGTQLALGRAAQDYASNEYQNVFNRALAAHGQNVSDYQAQFNDALASSQQNQSLQNQGFNQALQQYQTNYGTFLNNANLGLQARAQNENEYLQNQLAPSQYAYGNQYQQYLQANANALNDYLTNYGINRTGVQDFLNQNNLVSNQGLLAAYYSRPTAPTT